MNRRDIMPDKEKLKEECLICKAPLVYMETDEMMECVICHKKEYSKTKCTAGHYICNECHMQGTDRIIGLCLQEASADPIEILEKLMSFDFCHMHGPEHHIIVGSALLTAYKNAGGDLDLKNALLEMQRRGKQIPGGACGFWGACGAGISSGMFMSIITKSTPLSQKAWGLSNRMTSYALGEIGKVDGPRCCKRDSYLAVLSAVHFVRENLNIEMKERPIVCQHSSRNNQCIGRRCPFSK